MAGTIVAISFALFAGAARPEAPSVSAECQAARDLLQISRSSVYRSQKPAEPWVFRGVDADEVDSYVRRPSIRRLNSGWRRPPTAQLLARFKSTRGTGPLADCKGFNSFVSRLGGRSGKAAEEEAARPPATGSVSSSAEFVEMSTPVVSQDGKRALVYFDTSCGITCGAGFLLHLARRPNGEWYVLDRLGLWIA